MTTDNERSSQDNDNSNTTNEEEIIQAQHHHHHQQQDEDDYEGGLNDEAESENMDIATYWEKSFQRESSMLHPQTSNGDDDMRRQRQRDSIDDSSQIERRASEQQQQQNVLSETATSTSRSETTSSTSTPTTTSTSTSTSINRHSDSGMAAFWAKEFRRESKIRNAQVPDDFSSLQEEGMDQALIAEDIIDSSSQQQLAQNSLTNGNSAAEQVRRQANTKMSPATRTTNANKSGLLTTQQSKNRPARQLHTAPSSLEEEDVTQMVGDDFATRLQENAAKRVDRVPRDCKDMAFLERSKDMAFLERSKDNYMASNSRIDMTRRVEADRTTAPSSVEEEQYVTPMIGDELATRLQENAGKRASSVPRNKKPQPAAGRGVAAHRTTAPLSLEEEDVTQMVGDDFATRLLQGNAAPSVVSVPRDGKAQPAAVPRDEQQRNTTITETRRPQSYEGQRPGAYSILGRNFGPVRRRSTLGRRPRRSSRSSGSSSNNPLEEESPISPIIASAVLVESDLDDEELARRESEVIERERQLAEHAERLRQLEAELEAKRRELYENKPTLIHAEVINSEPSSRDGSLKGITIPLPNIKRWMSNSHSDGLGEELTFDIDISEALKMEAEPSMDYHLVKIELGEGPMRFFDTEKRRLETELRDLSMPDRRCYKKLKMRWEDRLAKKRPGFEFSREMILRFARCTARSSGFSEERAWKRMCKFKKHYLYLSAHRLETQLFTKVGELLALLFELCFLDLFMITHRVPASSLYFLNRPSFLSLDSRPSRDMKCFICGLHSIFRM